MISGASRGITKEGSGILILSNTNTYTGDTTINAGTLAITNATGLGTTAAGTTIASGATLDLQNVAVLTEAITINGGTLATSTGTSSLSGTITLGATNNTFSVAGTQLTLSGVISGTGSGFTKEGSGILVLSNANTYTGATTINAGTLSASSLANGGTASGIGQSTSDAANLVINGGTLKYTGSQITINRLFTIGANGATIDNSSSGLNFGNSGSLVVLGTSPILTLTGSTMYSASLTPVLVDPSGGTLSIVKNGTGTGAWVLSGANTFTGTAIISSGTLVPGLSSLTNASLVRVDSGAFLRLPDTAITSSPFTKAITLNGGTLTGGTTGGVLYVMNAPITLTADSQIAMTGGSGLTLKSLSVISGAYGVSYNGIIGGTSYSSPINIDSSNTYTGVSTVSFGTFTVSTSNAFGSSIGQILLGGSSGTAFTNLYATGGINIARDITVQAGSTGSATIGISGATTATFSGNIILNKKLVLSGGANSNGCYVNFSGVISGANQSIDITGTNSLGDGVILSNANTYSGATTIVSGRLKLANANALGNSPSVSISSATVVFDLNGYDIAKPITLAGTGFITNTNTGSTSRITGGITLGGANGYLSPKSGATLIVDTLPILGTLTSVLNIGTQTTALYDGNGTVIIQVANNTFGGGTILHQSPVLKIGVNDALAGTGSISVGDGTSASRGNLDLAGFTVSNAISIPTSTTLALIYSSQGSANLTGAVTISTATVGAVTFGAYAGSSLTFSGSITGGTSAIKIGYASGAFPTNTSVGAGAGTVIFSGSAVVNGYSGSTTILNGSTLDIKYDSATTSTADPLFTSTYLLGTGGGNVIIEPYTTGGTISLGSTGSTLNLPVYLFNGVGGTRKFADGFTNITIGSSTAGNIDVSGTATFTDSVALVSGGNITINSGASISDSQASGNLVIAALGNFINNAGSSALVTTDAGATDRWVVYSATPASDTFGGLVSGNKAYWGSTYLSAPPAVIGAGNRYVFGDSPTITTTDAQKTYGNTVDLSTNYSLGGAYQTNPATYGNVYLAVTSSDIFATLPTISSTGSSSGASVGTYAITASGASANTGYGFSYANTGILTVDPATIVLGIVGSKTYDGNKTFAAGPDLVVSGLNVGDVLATATANSAQVSDNGSNYFVSFTLSSGTASNYSLVSGYNAATNSATINKANAYVIIGSGQSSTYGSTPTITYTFNANAAGTGSAITTATTGTAVITNAPSATSDAATYSLTYASGLNSTNYSFNPAASAVNYIVNPVSLVVTGANNSVAYNGSAQTNSGATATVNGSAATITGNTIATGIGSQSFTLSGYGSGTNASATPYADNLQATAGSGTTASNYNISYTNAGLTINKANAYVIIGSGQSSTYGSTPTITYTFNANAAGTGSAITTATTGTAVITNAPSATSDAATYSLTYASGLNSTNYSFNPAASAVNYIVNPVSLVVTGANNSVAYNGSAQTNSGATATVNGSAATITGNTIATGIGSQSFTLSGYGSGTNASATPYADNLQATAGSGTTASNYNISYTNAGLTINKANAYVIIGSGQSSTYGSTPTITYTFNANAAGTGSAITTATTGTAVITFNGFNSVTATSNSGTYGLYYTSGLSSTNYTFSRATGTVNFVVNPAILNLTISKTYDGFSSFSSTNTYTLSGTLYNGDSYPTITPGRTALTNSANAATYSSFTSSNLTLLDGNYTLTGGTVSATIDKANAYVIIGSGQSSTYGSTPSINYTFNTNAAGSGSSISSPAALVGLSGTAVITNAPTSSSGAASYDLTYSTGLTSTNYIYNPASNSVNFTVNPKPITLTANARSTTYGTALSLGTTAYSITSGGLNIGETISSVTLKYQGSDTVGDTTNAGTYTSGIVASDATGTGGFNSTNYAITYRPANLTVNKKSVTITNNTSSTTYDGVSTYADLVGSASFTTTALAGSDAVGSVTQRTTVGGNLVSGIAQAGTFISTPSAAVLSTGTASNYLFTYTPSTNVVVKANLSVTATPSISGNVYNGNAYTGTYTTTLLGADAITVTGLATGTNAGTYTSNLQVSGTALGNYNTPTITNANLVISPKPLLISGQTASNKTYDSTTDALLNSNNAALVGVVGSDPVELNAAAAYGSFASADVGNSIPVTVLGNTLSGSAAGNYTLSQPTGLSANITKAPLTVTADNVATFIGQGLPSSYTVSYSGFVQGQTAGNSGVIAGSVANSANISSGAGTYTLTPSGFSANNYSISYVTGTYTIAPADTLVVQAGSHAITYGNNVSLTPSSVQYYLNGTGVVNLNYVSSVGNTYTYNDNRGGNVTFTLSPANAVMSSSNNLSFGSYQISGGNLIQSGTINLIGAGVYTGSLSVGQQAVTASASSVSKVYDGTTTMNGLSISLSPVISGDQVTAGGSGAFAQKNVGSNINYSVSNLALSGVDSNNYYLAGGTNFSGSNGVITPATLTYTAAPASSTYGSIPSVNAGSVTGFVAGENQANATSGGLLFSTTATNLSNVGSYPIYGSGLAANDGNYNFGQAAGNATALTVNPATLTYTATPVSAVAGTLPNVNNGSVIGFVNNQNQSIATTGTLLFSTNASSTSGAGTYSINGSGLVANNGNYIFVQAPSNATALTITPAPNPTPATGSGSGISVTGCIVGMDEVKDQILIQSGLCVAVK
ncbi:YDG domain-containing protein [Polynucleobacter sp. 80A-SIGWE]|uniref:YDG domain-containing protein n=1 Tax=Polynucleobacter sp. 80A-SIGWE TaxID=2689100 RepID=UPI00351D576F